MRWKFIHTCHTKISSFLIHHIYQPLSFKLSSFSSTYLTIHHHRQKPLTTSTTAVTNPKPLASFRLFPVAKLPPASPSPSTTNHHRKFPNRPPPQTHVLVHHHRFPFPVSPDFLASLFFWHSLNIISLLLTCKTIRMLSNLPNDGKLVTTVNTNTDLNLR